MRKRLDGPEVHPSNPLLEAELSFDLPDISDLIGRNERNHDAAGAGASGPA